MTSKAQSIVLADRQYEEAMREGSRKLLAAMWASHPWIMQQLRAHRP